MKHAHILKGDDKLLHALERADELKGTIEDYLAVVNTIETGFNAAAQIENQKQKILKQRLI